MAYVIEALADHHDRDVFCCGRDEQLDKFCRSDAWAHHTDRFNRVKVARIDGSSVVVGYHALRATQLKESRLAYVFGRHTRFIPAVQLSMIAICQDQPWGNLGPALIRDVFETTLAVADQIGACCLYLEAANDRLAAYYSENGFERISSKSLGMFIPVDTIRDALS